MRLRVRALQISFGVSMLEAPFFLITPRQKESTAACLT
jgi:hypothetical protein